MTGEATAQTSVKATTHDLELAIQSLRGGDDLILRHLAWLFTEWVASPQDCPADTAGSRKGAPYDCFIGTSGSEVLSGSIAGGRLRLVSPRRLPREGKSCRAVADATRDVDSQQVDRAGELETQAQAGVDMTVRGIDEGRPADLHDRGRDKAALILESRVWQHPPQFRGANRTVFEQRMGAEECRANDAGIAAGPQVQRRCGRDRREHASGLAPRHRIERRSPSRGHGCCAKPRGRARLDVDGNVSPGESPFDLAENRQMRRAVVPPIDRRAELPAHAPRCPVAEADRRISAVALQGVG